MAKLRLDFHPEARLEADAAFEYYYERSPKVAEAFYLALEISQLAIQDSPERWAEYLHGTRRYLPKRFHLSLSIEWPISALKSSRWLMEVASPAIG